MRFTLRLPEDTQATFAARLRPRIRKNTYDAQSDTVTVSEDRAAAISQVAEHYKALFGNDPELQPLREAYAMKNDTVPDAQHRRALAAFFWWSAWAAGTERPTDAVVSSTGPVSIRAGSEPMLAKARMRARGFSPAACPAFSLPIRIAAAPSTMPEELPA